MLAHLPAVVAEMKRLKPVFREALIEETRAGFDELYAKVVAAYETWRAMATANLVVPHCPFHTCAAGRRAGARDGQL